MNLRRTIATLLAALMLLALTACGAGTTPPAQDTNTPAEEADPPATESNQFRVGMECGYAPFNWAQVEQTEGSVPIDGNQGYADGYNQNAYNLVPQKKTSTKAILSLIFGIAGIVTCCGFGILGVILGIAGVVLAILSRNDNDGKMEGLAIAGLIVSIVAFVFGLGYLCIMVFAIAEDPNFLTDNIASAAVRVFNGNVIS